MKCCIKLDTFFTKINCLFLNCARYFYIKSACFPIRLANNNYFIPAAPEVTSAPDVSGVGAEAEDRIAGYMERFEQIFAMFEEEFGTDLAPSVMDLVMDKLMGMV